MVFLASELGVGVWSFSDEMSLERGIRARGIRKSTTHVGDERRGMEGMAAVRKTGMRWLKRWNETMKKRTLTSRSFYSSAEGSRFLESPSKNEIGQTREGENNEKLDSGDGG